MVFGPRITISLKQEMMIALVRKYPLGFLAYALILAAGTALVISVPQPELHLAMNSSHSGFLDAFFRTATWLGDGWFALGFSLVFLLVSYRYFLMLILSWASSGLLVQLIKRLAFPGASRPVEWLGQMPELQTVPGVELLQSYSFPSGHAATAFAVWLLVGFILRSRPVFFLGVMLAWCVGFSRVYLSQHFLIDVLAGSFIGTLSALFFYWYFQRLKPEWLDRSLRNHKPLTRP